MRAPDDALRDLNRADLWIRHSGRWFRGRLDRVADRQLGGGNEPKWSKGGVGGWVVFRTKKSGRKRIHQIPGRNACRWTRTAAEQLLPEYGWDDGLVALVDRLKAGGSFRLHDPGFEAQTLANTIDRLVGFLAVDRGPDARAVDSRLFD